jgi:gamma-glutamyltranspeptidase/glutathione hydrolase
MSVRSVIAGEDSGVVAARQALASPPPTMISSPPVSTIHEARGCVAAGHPVTAAAAAEILRAGGNAFDAALAAVAAACVAEPVLCSTGGGGFMLARPADAPARIYDFFVHTPHRRRPPAEVHAAPVVTDWGTTSQEFQIGLGTAATPGLVRGLFAVHRDLGRTPMPAILAPAVAAARAGIEITPVSGLPPDPRRADLPRRARRARAVRRPLRRPAAPGRAPAKPRPRRPARGPRSRRRAPVLRGRRRRRDRRPVPRRGRPHHQPPTCTPTASAVRRTPLTLRYRDATLTTNPPPSAGGVADRLRPRPARPPRPRRPRLRLRRASRSARPRARPHRRRPGRSTARCCEACSPTATLCPATPPS